ncbi:MAG: (2Fe-2S)-binding protein [Firmicutes bacterium HGW-Firmicutes-15]|nr:MAG: (2Fe-2S)-binding protein [Firmicutes bacterium HGW-Firmicutes-15]
MDTFSIIPPCPNCNNPGQQVNIKTVRSLINEAMAYYVAELQCFICMSPDCRTSYYTKEGSYFDNDAITVPIWFKEQSPVPICYCKNIRDEDILEHVSKRKCCTSIEDIQNHTGANTGKECLTRNPTGK